MGGGAPTGFAPSCRRAMGGPAVWACGDGTLSWHHQHSDPCRRHSTCHWSTSVSPCESDMKRWPGNVTQLSWRRQSVSGSPGSRRI